MTEISYSARFTQVAKLQPQAPMLTLVETLGDVGSTLTWQEADDASNQMAGKLGDAGVAQGDYITIALPNGFEFVIACIAAWKLGAVPQPVSSRLPDAELDAIVALANSRAVLGVQSDRYAARICWPQGWAYDANVESTQLPDRISPSWKAPTSGGSTGRPKLIVSNDPATFDPDDLGMIGVLAIQAGGTTIMPGPLYHNGPFIWVFSQLLRGGHVVLLKRFEAALTLDAIARFQGEVVYLVPTMMSRIWKLPAEQRDAFDLSSLKKAWHLAAPCPEWLKREWLQWLGPDRLWELYGGTEAQAVTVISGDDWLTHPGSVGQAAAGEIKIVDDDGNTVGPGQTGEVYMRPDVGRVTYFYMGADAKVLGDRWESLGDMGWLDDEGFLYLTDRRTDMILTGGANVYPAEVESAIESYPAVRSCAVIGLPDEDLGQAVHAIVQATDVSELELTEHVAGILTRYKVPRSIEFVDEPLRDDAGKVRRSQLLAERVVA
jgi:bile acid-coenzyme A ligase